MSTAIIGTWTGHEYVVASDGLSVSSIDGREECRNVRKIFELPLQAGRCLVYAVMGNPEISEDETGDKVVNFPADIASRAKNASAVNILEFVSGICTPLNDLLRQARISGRISSYPENDIGTILFAGYFDSTPDLIEVRFFHDRQVLKEPEIKRVSSFHYGSHKIARRISSGDSSFKKYGLSDPFSNLLDRTIEFSKNSIDAYGDPNAREIDPMCKSIGGMTQVCIVRRDGVEWVYGPANG